MNENLNSILSNIADFLKTETKTETVIGKEFSLGEFKCVPVMNVGFGYGVGGGEGNDPKTGKGSGSGGGAGLGMTPIGFLVTKGEMIQFIAAKKSSGLTATFEKLPELFEKYMEKSTNGNKA